MIVEIRHESPEDVAAIYALNAAAFETPAEARLVDALRANGALCLSLVAVVEGELVGHIAFSPVTLEAPERTWSGAGLAPMAVDATHRRRGIGGRLIAEGLNRLRSMSQPFCVVLGHADYYPRFGFMRASDYGIRWEKPVPEEVFFVQPLSTEGLLGQSGVVRFRPEFDAV